MARMMTTNCPRCRETLYLNGDMEIADANCSCDQDEEYTDHEWSLIYSNGEYDTDPAETEGDIRYHQRKEEGWL